MAASVIVPFYNAEDFLDEAVRSLQAQRFDGWEALLVDDGSSDGSLELARSLTESDDRFTVLSVPHGGQGAARNHGLRHARGKYVTFMDADDVLPPGAYAAMVASLEASGSDMVLGNVERFDSTRTWTPRWARSVHARDVQGATLATMPEAMRDILACNRMYRRSFWDARVGSFPEGMIFEDHAPMLKALLGGTRFDVLAEVTYRWRRREDGLSSSQPKDELANLVDRARAKADAWALLEREGTPTERALWTARVLDLDLVPYLNHAGTAEVEYQELLAATVATYLEHGSSTPEGRRELAARVRGPQRLAAWYAAHREWSALASLAADLADRRPPLARLERSGAHGPRAVVGDHARTTSTPPLPGWWAEVPLDITPSLVLTRLTWDADGLVIRGILRIPGLSLEAAETSVLLVVGDQQAPLRTQVAGPARRRPDAPLTGTDLNVVATVPRTVLASLPRAVTPVSMSLVLAGEHTAPVTFTAGTGTRAPRSRAEILDGTTVLPMVTDDGLHLRTSTPVVVATLLGIADGRLRVTLSAGPQPVTVAFGSTDSHAALVPEKGAWTIALADLAHAAPDAPLEAVIGTRSVRVVAPTMLRNTLPRGLAASARGTLHAVPGPRSTLADLTADDDGLALGLVESGLADVPEGSTWHAVLRDGDTERTLPIAGNAPARARLDVPRATATEGGRRPTVASVRLTLVGPDGTVVPLRVDDRALDAQPFTAPSGAYDVRVVARKDGIELRVEHLETGR